jgi:gas vesicle protein
MQQLHRQAQTGTARDYTFVAGLLAGTVVGAGLALWLAPKAVEATNDVRDRLADAVVRGAHEVERVAVAAKTDRA